MRVLPFTKYSPCGNTTILVREASLSPADRARVAAEIIAPGHLEAEQAGYVDTAAPVPRLDMMGGEFCVNATRAFAALLAEEGKLSPESGGLGGIVSVSGMPGTPARPRPASGRPLFRVRRSLGSAASASVGERGSGHMSCPGAGHCASGAGCRRASAPRRQGSGHRRAVCPFRAVGGGCRRVHLASS